jgi:hypothetical protein
MKKKIEKLLCQALINNGKMEYALFEYELKEHIDYWYRGLKRDKEELVFAVTVNRGHVAMVLITKNQDIYVNEDARELLAQEWKRGAYKRNMEKLIPMMADDLANDILAVKGVKYASPEFENSWKKITANTKQIQKLSKLINSYQGKNPRFLPDKKSD